MRAMAVTPTAGRKGWFVLAVLVGGVVGLFIGTQIKAGQGYDCGPLPGFQSTITLFVLGVVGGALLLVAVFAAVFGRSSIAKGFLVALVSLGVGAMVGTVVGAPVDRCQPPTSYDEPAVLMLHLDGPYDLDVAGPGRCVRDIASRRVLALQIEDEGPEPVHWIKSDVRIIEIAMGYGLTEPGLQIGFQTGGTVLYRQSADDQVNATAAADQNSGTYEFHDLPIEDGSPLVDRAETLSGSLDWRCPDDSLRVN